MNDTIHIEEAITSGVAIAYLADGIRKKTMIDMLQKRNRLIQQMGYGILFPQLPTEIDEDEKQRKELEEIRRTWNYGDSMWGNMMPEKVCNHKWKITLGIYREYRDCEHCKAKYEDVYPNGER